MANIELQIRRARRRLNINLLLHRACVGALIAAGAWGLVTLAERLFALGVPYWPSIWLAAGVAALIALLGTWAAKTHELEAAVVLDRAAGTKERLSTALAIGNSTDPFARAAVDDATKSAGRVHVPACVPLRAPWMWPWSIASVVAVALFGAFMPTLHLFAGQPDGPDAAQQLKQAERERKEINAALMEQSAKLKELAKDNPALASLADKIQPLSLPDQPTVTPDDVRREALKQLDNLKDELARERESARFESADAIKQALAKLESRSERDPASQLATSLSQGDLTGAKKAIEELKKELADAAKSADAETREKMDAMAKQLERVAKQLAEAVDRKPLQKELQNKAGLTEKQARKLLEEVAKMDPKQLEKELQKRLGEAGVKPEQIEQLAREMAKKLAENQECKKQCEGLGQALAKAADAMKQAQSGGGQQPSEQNSASDALSDASDQLSEMEMAEQMMSDLEAQLKELKQLREGVCQGQGPKPDGEQDEIGGQGPQYGLGYGSSIGKEKAAHEMTPTRVKAPLHKGEIIGQMLFDGPQVRGEARAAVRDAVNSAVRDATDAIAREDVPRQYSRAVREYFNSLAGLIEKPAGAGESKPRDGASQAGDGEKR
ncbi:MAG: hypothetical protein AB7Q17_02720 [Phycisphaerae bacterium]